MITFAVFLIGLIVGHALSLASQQRLAASAARTATQSARAEAQEAIQEALFIASAVQGMQITAALENATQIGADAVAAAVRVSTSNGEPRFIVLDPKLANVIQ